MKITTRLATFLALSVTLLPTAALADPDASGVWMRGDGNAKVEIAPCGSKLCATNVWIKDDSKGESVGDKLVMDVKPSGADSLKGSAYDSKRDATYSISIKVSSTRLVTRGCIVGVLCKSESWSKAQ